MPARHSPGTPASTCPNRYYECKQTSEANIVDKHGHSSKLKLVLCGSTVEVMKSLLLESSPLYGRVDLTIDLKSIDYHDSALFYPGFNDDDKVRLFSVFGGIPYYNKLIDHDASVRQDIIELIAAPDARLANEIPMYLRSEMAKLVNANEVFDALSQGRLRYGDLMAQSHVSSGPALVDVLERLRNMEVVAKEAPINDPLNKRKTFYSITDPLSLFYY